ncbi:MAG: hypothetical protein UV40_C0016G0007 [Parcubacteria group bacterium GW2011_GWA1_42_7]|nr:MAG: hypothetical protein UV34_C0001G0037 [Parcubacteria group bacterium GW2011_GWB1_42_6]KKS69715.1 MAG: hypothetical protein UV40_C0016G0007 [Parcubacteria group bacterium GW2011_GWA1_42_7]KKS92322.1 MAG: hypothetical protein UV67_C0006G0038 [Parcubacteria group bacterium GW2011_GWC1_43_12]
MEATAINPVLEAIQKIIERIERAEEGWEERAASMISVRMQFLAPSSSRGYSKPRWKSYREQKEYETLLEIACNLFENYPKNKLFRSLKDSIFELLEKHFENSLASMPKEVRNSAVEHFPLFCSP